MSKEQYVFDYPFETVLKGFWHKYPHPDLSFVKDNFVLSYDIIDEQTLHVKRLMYSKMYKYLWCYTIEDIKIYFDKRAMEMKSKIIKTSSMFPPTGQAVELISYKALEDFKTVYEKSIQGTEEGFIKKYAKKFNNTFQKGCQIIEENCKKITEEMKSN
ncbi:hypothetical protein ABPG74_022652 [Tetrahymena malaccensis]